MVICCYDTTTEFVNKKHINKGRNFVKEITHIQVKSFLNQIKI